jgi:hypothetical protein
MRLLSSIIQSFEAEFLERYRDALLPGQRRALAAMKNCRTSLSPVMRVQCDDCGKQVLIPHSCGHRSCPHCQQHESQQWLERQLAKQLPAGYFLLTFTLPAELRPLAWRQQRVLYDLLLRCSWETLQTFARNDRQLQGEAGAISVLHTHSRRLDYHPHVHVVMPAAAVDTQKRLWRSKHGNNGYLFNHKALAKVFRGKMLAALRDVGLELPDRYPESWVVDVKSVGAGNKALLYLGRYLYKGVIREQDIIACRDGQVTFRYRDGKTQKLKTRTLPGAQFLWLILQHVLPKGFRRARNFGFLHPNSKRLIALLQQLLKYLPPQPPAASGKRPPIPCPCCGAAMRIVQTQIPRPSPLQLPVPAG